jgi:predicted permease
MTLTALTVLLPVFFVLGLGYFAGHSKKFDADQVAGLNELVLDYAFPAMMFVATVKTPRDELLSEGSYALALLVAFVGLFLAVVLVSTRLLRHSLGEATLQANLASSAFSVRRYFKGCLAHQASSRSPSQRLYRRSR